MSDAPKDKRFGYLENSNIIFRSDRPRDVGPKSDVLSLTQKYSTNDLLRQMGDRVDRSTPAELLRLKEAAMERKRKQEDASVGTLHDLERDSGRHIRRRRAAASAASALANIDTFYTPLTKETRDAYAVFLAEIKQISGFQEQDVLREVAHELLLILTNPEVTIVTKQTSAARLLHQKGALDPGSFSRLYNISQKLTDFKISAEDSAVEGKQDTSTDEAITINVDDLTEEGEGDDAGGISFYEVGGEGDDLLDDMDDLLGDGFDEAQSDEMDDLLSDTVSASRARGRARSKIASEEVDPMEIDGYWLERQLQMAKDTEAAALAATGAETVTTDPAEIGVLAEKVLALLENPDVTTGQLESALLRLLGLPCFALVKRLLKNRWTVFFCVKYHRAGTPGERDAIREEIESHPSLSHINEILFGAEVSAQRHAPPQANSQSRMSDRHGAVPSPSSASASSSSTSSAYWKRPVRAVDIEELEAAAGTPDLNPDVTLPDNAVSIQKKGYQEIHIPPAQAPPMGVDEHLVPIDEIPSWAHPAFANMRSLNRIQSRIYNTAMFSPENMLICAPTGAGKTNCAMLTMLREVGKAQLTPEAASSCPTSNITTKSPEAPFLDLAAFKIVYIAPMKSLVQEMVLNFGNRLRPFGISVRELSGDAQLSRAEIAATQVIVTTPEKWDIVTRKDGEARSLTRAVRLVIIDEVHLLHDSRGPVLESIVARSHRQTETWLDHTRIVGLSATLPNYEDVALFLRVRPESGLFHFSNAYRPCPLQQQFIGITHKRALARQEAMSALTYEKTTEQLSGEKKNQVLVFVHSRKDTVATAMTLRDTAVERGELDFFTSAIDSAARKLILQDAAAEASHPALKELIPVGIAFHHAGMSRADRTLVEELFAAQHVMVLVSTATLAWGVNLPAHTVIIKGTQVYSPEKGRWVELSPQDVTQMIGRAGRPQYDTYGEGILITNHSHMLYYLALMNSALNIESQFLGKLADTLNAEIVAGSIKSISDATRYLGYTFLYVRMLQMQNNALYGTSFDMIEKDPDLEQYRADLSHSAAITLARGGLISYDRKSGHLSPTPLGRVAAYYYLSHQSAEAFAKTLSSDMTDIELFRAFSFASEFSGMSVRGDEKVELMKLLDRVPIPVRESADSAPAKANVLLQVYISRQSIDGFAINADMIMVAQSAGRIARAMFEICLANRWAQAAARALGLCKMISRRMWPTLSPIRQFPLDAELSKAVQRLERLELPWSRCLDMDPASLSEVIRLKEESHQADAMRRRLHAYIHRIPHVIPTVDAQPLSHSSIAVSLTLECDFVWDTPSSTSTTSDLSSSTTPLLASEGYWLVVEDADGANILHHEYITLRQENPKNPLAQSKYNYFIVLPVFTNPLPPHYMVKLYSDKWFGADASLPISLRKIILPEPTPAPTELLDLRPASVAQLQNEEYISFFTSGVSGPSTALTLGRIPFRTFNSIQTQVFDAVYSREDNMLLAAPVGSGKTVVAELGIMNMLSSFRSFTSGIDLNDDSEENDRQLHHARAVYLTPFEASARCIADEWRVKFDKNMHAPVRMLTGDVTADLTLFTQATVIVSTYANFYALTKKWSLEPGSRKAAVIHASSLLRSINLVIPVDLHFLGDPQAGPGIELAITSLRFIAAELQLRSAELQKAAVAPADTIAEWLYRSKIRIIGLSVPIANARDVGEWLPCAPQYVFAFDSTARPSPLDLRIEAVDVLGAEARQTAVIRSCFRNIVDLAPDEPVLVFTPSRRLVMEIATEMASLASQHSLEIHLARAKTTPGYVVPSEETIRKDTNSMFPVLLRVEDPNEIRSHLAHCSPAVAELLANGVGVYHDGLTPAEKHVVRYLFASRAIQILVADAGCCFEIQNAFNAALVLITDTQTASHRGDHRSTNVKIAALLHMAGRANANFMAKSPQMRYTCVVYCAAPQKAFLTTFLTTPFTVESYLDTDFERVVNSLIVSGARTNRHEILDFTTWTFLYRRLRRNPHFYRLPLPTKEQVSEFLSELIETSLETLVEMGFIALDEEDVDAAAEPLNLGIVAEHYQLVPATVEVFYTALTTALSKSSSGTSKARFGLLELLDVLICAGELEDVVGIRPREATSLRRLANHLPLPITAQSTAVALQGPDLGDVFNCTPSKAYVLLQAHLSRVSLATSAEGDLRKLLPLTLRLVSALMDISSSALLLSPILVGLEFAQMVTMAVWGLGVKNTLNAPSALLQIPHITPELAVLLQSKYEVQGVSDLLELDDGLRAQLLLSSWGILPGPNGKVTLAGCSTPEERTLLKSQMNDVATFCNAYPDLTIEHEILTTEEDMIAGDQGAMMVTLKKSSDEDEDEDDDEEEEEEIPIVVAAKYPEPKVETWWLVLGSVASNELWAMKKVILKKKEMAVKLPFRISEQTGLTKLKLFVLSDSYVGVDQEFDLNVEVLEQED